MAQAGIDLGKLSGSGPNGRIVKADVEAQLSSPAKAPAPAPRPLPPPVAAPPAPKPAPLPVGAAITPVPNSTMQIARRLSESKATIPHFYVAMDIELDALLDLRAKLNARSPKEGPGAYKLSVNDLIIKAAAVTLRRIPAWPRVGPRTRSFATTKSTFSWSPSPFPDGLITPIVKGADVKGLAAISNEMKDLGARAKSGKKPEEFQGGCFSISNMGMYGVKDFAAIINPPQAGILAVGAGEQRPVVRTARWPSPL